MLEPTNFNTAWEVLLYFCCLSCLVSLLFFMFVGHIKFGQEDLAREIAGVYQKLETYNFGMFLQYVISCASGEVYDGSEILHDFKTTSEFLFDKIDKIIILLVFYLVADDGQFHFGALVRLPAVS